MSLGSPLLLTNYHTKQTTCSENLQTIFSDTFPKVLEFFKSTKDDELIGSSFNNTHGDDDDDDSDDSDDGEQGNSNYYNGNIGDDDEGINPDGGGNDNDEDEYDDESDEDDEDDDEDDEDNDDGDTDKDDDFCEEDDEEANSKQEAASYEHRLKGKKTVPATIKRKSHVYDVALHPTKTIIASGEISGLISLYHYSEEENKFLFSLKHHKGYACRSLIFSQNGDRLYTSSMDKTIQVMDMNTGEIIHTIADAHADGINKIRCVSENYIASGCDKGCVKVWDTRTFSSIMEMDDCKDYVSDMEVDKEGRRLLCTSGDGVLSVFDLHKKSLEKQSDHLEEELLSLSIMRNSEKVVCGSGDGTLNFYSWGQWGDVSDRLPTNAESIESICRISEDTLCFGSDNGTIRCLKVFPHKAIGVVGSHSGGHLVDNMQYCEKKELLVSCSGDSTVRFWDMSSMEEVQKESDEFEDSSEDEKEDKVKHQKKKDRKRKFDETTAENGNFFADL